MEQALAHAFMIHEAITVAHDTTLEAVSSKAAHAVCFVKALSHRAIRRARLDTRTILHRWSFHEVGCL